MKCALIQNPIYVSFDKTLKKIDQLIQECIKAQAEVIILPELWNTFYENSCIKESLRYTSVSKQYFIERSKQFPIYFIAGSIATEKENKIYNTCSVYFKGKEIVSYDKTHLFEVHSTHTSYQEKDVFSPGNTLQTFQIGNVVCGLEICYDLRFPELTRLLAKKGIQILFCPSAFNRQVGPIHWKPLLQTRALENEIFVVGTNPAPYTYKSYSSYGHSMVVDPFGKPILEMIEEEWAICNLHIEQVNRTRKKMPFWQIRRTDLYEIEEKKYEKH